MKKIFYLTLLTAIIVIACQPKTASVDVRAEADAIRNLEDQWTAAIKAKNIDKIVSFFASEAVRMEPNKPIDVGIEAIRKSREFNFSDTTILLETYLATIDTIEVSASGDLGYTRGTERVNQNTPNGPVEEVDKFIDIWKKIDAEWKVIVTIWNSDKPLEGQ
jgi:ketosteroid isomerase-like protein